MINKLGWITIIKITNTKNGQRSNPSLKSKNLNEEGCLQWRCTLWKPLSGRPLEKTLWIKAKDLSDYSGKDGIIGGNAEHNQWFSLDRKRDIRSTFSYLCTKHYPLKYVTNFSYGLVKLIEKFNAFCILLWRSQRLLNLNQKSLHWLHFSDFPENHKACCICIWIRWIWIVHVRDTEQVWSKKW